MTARKEIHNGTRRRFLISPLVEGRAPSRPIIQITASFSKIAILLCLLPFAAFAQSKTDDTLYLPENTTPSAAAPVPKIPVEHHLLDLTTLQPAPLLEIRYATKYNFTGEQLYPFPRAWLHQDAAKALQLVQQDLAKQGLGLKVYDGYRPLSVQRTMWNLIRDERYVSNPDVSRGRHTRGVAVDITLVDKLGKELPMPTDFDDFSEKAHRNYEGATPAQLKNRKLLEDAMKNRGFFPFPYEWWHFDLLNWQSYPPLDIRFEELMRGDKTTMPPP